MVAGGWWVGGPTKDTTNNRFRWGWKEYGDDYGTGVFCSVRVTVLGV